MQGMAELVEECKREADRQLAELLRAHGVDPDDRSEGWEDRAREVFRNFEWEQTVEADLASPGGQRFAASVTMRLRPKRG